MMGNIETLSKDFPPYASTKPMIANKKPSCINTKIADNSPNSRPILPIAIKAGPVHEDAPILAISASLRPHKNQSVISGMK